MQEKKIHLVVCWLRRVGSAGLSSAWLCRTWTAGVIVVASLLVTQTVAQAGLHHRPVADEILHPVPSWAQFFDNVIPRLRSFAPPDPLSGLPASLLRQAALKRIEFLQRQPEERLSADDYADYTGLLLRLGSVEGRSSFDLAYRFLERGRARFPRDYRLAANLATLNQLNGEYDRAIALLEEAIALAPENARKHERWHLRLVWQRRAQEEQRRLGRLPREEAVLDDLFGIPFGETNRVDAKPTELAQAPPSWANSKEAGEVLQQLLIWFPFDGQLWWLLGEYLASQGDWPGAARAIQAASDLRIGGQRFRQRRAAILEAAERHRSQASAPPVPEILVIDESEEPATQKTQLWARFGWQAWVVVTLGGTLLLFLAVWQVRIWARRLLRR